MANFPTFPSAADARTGTLASLTLTEPEFKQLFPTLLDDLTTAISEGKYKLDLAANEVEYNQIKLFLGSLGYRVLTNRDGAEEADPRRVVVSWNE